MLTADGDDVDITADRLSLTCTSLVGTAGGLAALAEPLLPGGVPVDAPALAPPPRTDGRRIRRGTLTAAAYGCGGVVSFGDGVPLLNRGMPDRDDAAGVLVPTPDDRKGRAAPAGTLTAARAPAVAEWMVVLGAAWEGPPCCAWLALSLGVVLPREPSGVPVRPLLGALAEASTCGDPCAPMRLGRRTDSSRVRLTDEGAVPCRFNCRRTRGKNH